MAVNNTSPKKSKKALAEELGISRQSLYYKPKMPEKDLKFKAEIEKVMSGNKAYGHKRIAWHLGANKKRVLRVMKIFGLKPERKRRAPKKSDDINQAPMAVPNLIKGMTIEAQNQVWVSDFTFLPHFNRFVYLATVEDVFTRQIVGWEISTRHNADFVCQTLLNAVKFHETPGIIHSDQGSEYRSHKYLNLSKSLGVRLSMSGKASPWENGYQESFYSEFKLELGHPECYPSLGELTEAVAKQIHYYNNFRIHTALKCPPLAFAERNCRGEINKKVDYINQLNFQGPRMRQSV